MVDLLTPINQICQSAAACPVVPSGWNKLRCPTNSNFSTKSTCASPSANSGYIAFVYQAQGDQFIARWRWRHMRDVELVASGGKDTIIEIEELDIQ